MLPSMEEELSRHLLTSVVWPAIEKYRSDNVMAARLQRRHLATRQSLGHLSTFAFQYAWRSSQTSYLTQHSTNLNLNTTVSAPTGKPEKIYPFSRGSRKICTHYCGTAGVCHSLREVNNKPVGHEVTTSILSSVCVAAVRVMWSGLS